MNIEFTPLGLKRCIDSFMVEMADIDALGYTLQKESDLVRVWTRSSGIDVNPDIPVARVDHFFPDVDDPRLILCALNDYRADWDGENYTTLDTLSEYTNANTQVQRLVSKGKFAIAGREFYDKKVFFSVRQAVLGLSGAERAKETKSCDLDDFYMLVTSVPDELVPPAPSQVVRADTIFGFYVIGKCANLPDNRKPSRSSRGCYIHGMQQADMKLNAWACRQLVGYTAGTMETWGEAIRNYIADNTEKLWRTID